MMGKTWASVFKGRQIISPWMVWARMTRHSCSVSGPGLLRMESGTLTLPMS
jgi:hypothetical protein